MQEIQYFYLAEWLVRLAMGLVIIVRRRSPTAALAWLVVVAFLPLVGAVLYFLIGENRLGRRRSEKRRALVDRVPHIDLNDARYKDIVHPELDDFSTLIARLAEAGGAGPTVGGNELLLLSETEAMTRRLVADIDAAEHHCHLLFYIYNDDEVGGAVGEALIRAAGRGVACRVLVDAVGSKVFLRSRLRRQMAKGGIQIAAALPVSPMRAAIARLDLRNHRKVAVIDGKVAYTGSHNISEPIYPRKARYGAWVDASVRVVGPTVRALQELFLEDWYFTTEDLPEDEHLLPPLDRSHEGDIAIQVLPTGPESTEAPLQDVMLQAIRMAKHRVVLTTPYFVPDEAILAAMRSAAMRGVDVLLVVPKHSDHMIAQAAGRSHYGYLLDVGVQIHEFTDGLLHAKTLTVDRQFAVIGSANLDVRSFLLNFEMALLIYNSDFASQIHFLQTYYIHHADRLTLESWRSRGKIRTVGDNLAKLLTPLL